MYEGLIALLWCLLWWWWFVEDSPDQDRSITDQELEYLQNTIGVTEREVACSPPWRAMLTSKPVWAIIIAHFTENWGFYTLLTSLPMFMRDVLEYSLDAAGILAAFPYILMAVVVQVGENGKSFFLISYFHPRGAFLLSLVLQSSTVAQSFPVKNWVESWTKLHR